MPPMFSDRPDFRGFHGHRRVPNAQKTLKSGHRKQLSAEQRYWVPERAASIKHAISHKPAIGFHEIF